MKRILSLVFITLLLITPAAYAAEEALQIDALWSGIDNPANGQPFSGAIVAFYASGTTTPKAVWENKEKTLPSAAGQFQANLDSNGQLKVFGDGVYKINVYHPNDTGLTTPKFTIDGVSYTNVTGTAVLGFDSVSDMRSGAGGDSDGQRSTLLGYSGPGDRGGGEFYWDSASTETDNTGTVVKVNSIATGRWIRLYSGNIHANWFGIDGTEDDVEINQAIQVARGLVLAVELSGEYTIADTIYTDTSLITSTSTTINVPENIVAIQIGVSATYPASGSLSITPAPWNVEVGRMSIIGEASWTTGSLAIRNLGSGTVIDNPRIENMGGTAHNVIESRDTDAGGSGGASNFSIRAAYIARARVGSGLAAIYVYGSDSTWEISDCFIQGLDVPATGSHGIFADTFSAGGVISSTGIEDFDKGILHRGVQGKLMINGCRMENIIDSFMDMQRPFVVAGFVGTGAAPSYALRLTDLSDGSVIQTWSGTGTTANIYYDGQPASRPVWEFPASLFGSVADISVQNSREIGNILSIDDQRIKSYNTPSASMLGQTNGANTTGMMQFEPVGGAVTNVDIPSGGTVYINGIIQPGTTAILINLAMGRRPNLIHGVISTRRSADNIKLREFYVASSFVGDSGTSWAVSALTEHINVGIGQAYTIELSDTTGDTTSLQLVSADAAVLYFSAVLHFSSNI